MYVSLSKVNNYIIEKSNGRLIFCYCSFLTLYTCQFSTSITGTNTIEQIIQCTYSENRYLGRVTCKEKKYLRYDTNVVRLEHTLNQLRKDLEARKDVEAGNQTLNEWFDTWMKIYKYETVKIGTYKNYQRHYDYYVREGFGKKRLKKISVSDI